MRTTAFTIILGVYGVPALATDLNGEIVPAGSLKDAPLIARNIYRHRPAKPAAHHFCEFGDGIHPTICDVAARPSSAPEKPTRPSGAR